MTQFLLHASPRTGYDGWALRNRASGKLVWASVCTTREQCRRVLRSDYRGDIFDDFEVVKVRISVEEA